MDILTVWWQRWFVTDAATAVLPVTYDPWLVALSVLVACAGGVAALQLSTIARHQSRFGSLIAHLAHALGALGLGSGVWGMHFIAMLAADIGQPVRYDPWITAASAVPALVASWMGLRLYTAALTQAPHTPRVAWRRWIGAGVWLGIGFGAMHYSGMAAMRMNAALRYEPVGVALSLLVAVTLATLGLGARQWLRLHTRLRGLPATVVSGCILGLATAGMHYTAMQASVFIGDADPTHTPGSGRSLELALTIAAELFIAFGFAWGVLGILAYRSMAARLREREALLRTMLDDMPVAAVRLRIHPDHSYTPVFASRALGELVGLPAEDYLQQRWTLQQRIHAEDLPQASERLLDALRTLQPQRITARLRHERDGWRHALLLAHAQATRDQRWLDIYALDITSEHRSNAERQALLAGIDRVACRALLSPQGIFLEANEPLARALGYTPAELVGRAHADVWPDSPEARSELNTFWTQLRAGQPIVGEFKRRARDGQTVHLLGAYQPLRNNDGAVQAVLKIALDISDRVRMLHELQRAQAALQDALAARTAFFANVSHEIRTPMNAIVGFAELLRDALPGDSPQREQAATIVASARALLRILNDLLDAAKLERGEFSLITQPVALPALLHGLISQFGVLAAQKGLTLQLDAAADVPRCIEADGDRLRQTLTNLLGNALKFTEHGSVTLGAARADAAQLRLWVQDTGIGIAPDRQRAIFEPFVQAEASTTRRYGGTGLGLSIVKQLVERMGGTVALYSEVGVGTRVEVMLPLRERPEGDCAVARASAPAADHAHRLRILAADDVAQNRELLARQLQRLGHEVTVVDNGQALLDCYAAAPDDWDAVLLDLQMPVLDGLATCERLRAFDAARGAAPVPVYALSASVMDDDRAAAQRVGMDGFLEKPLDVDALRSTLATIAPRAHPSDDLSRATAASHLPAALDTALHDGTPAPVDAARAQALWGQDWLAQAERWLQQTAPHWHGLSQWDRAAWHRIAGAAANLGLRALATAARACEHALVLQSPAPWQAADHAWRATWD
ncbi:MAG: MHYT domain-containing protein, partial [Tepidimonas sp.]|uniref:MHYT domain-containing protein n=1 Tax=Tepidimonas sp. TaxID=2002775 RepID=UPI004054FB19